MSVGRRESVITTTDAIYQIVQLLRLSRWQSTTGKHPQCRNNDKSGYPSSYRSRQLLFFRLCSLLCLFLRASDLFQHPDPLPEYAVVVLQGDNLFFQLSDFCVLFVLFPDVNLRHYSSSSSVSGKSFRARACLRSCSFLSSSDIADFPTISYSPENLLSFSSDCGKLDHLRNTIIPGFILR